MKSEWKVVILKDIIEFNPRESIKKASIAKKIPMEALSPLQRKIEFVKIENFTGGVKFRNGDTLMARITPSLENGKTAFVDVLNEDEVAFGSTEFFVLRAKQDKILPKYLYYISISNDLRNRAIKSMTGTSGRQRAQKESILDYEIFLPRLDLQKKIVSILDSLDSKIELNNQMIATLEELASTLFKRWFVDFEFPDENGNPYKTSGGKMDESEFGEIPEGWEVGKLSDIGEIIGGGTPSKKKEEYFKEGTISWITPKDLSEKKNVFISHGKTNITNLGLSKSSARLIPAKSVLFSSRAPIGYIAIASKEVSTNQGFKSVVPKEINQSEFVYLLLKNKVTDIESRATGSTFKEVSGSIMKNLPVIIPDSKSINFFCNVVKCWFSQIENLEQENDSLNDTRNILLPRLLSGEYEVV